MAFAGQCLNPGPQTVDNLIGRFGRTRAGRLPAAAPCRGAPSEVSTKPITILCPRLTCRAVLRVPETARGKRVRCPECGVAFMVPAANSPTRPSQEAPKPGADAPTGT